MSPAGDMNPATGDRPGLDRGRVGEVLRGLSEADRGLLRTTRKGTKIAPTDRAIASWIRGERALPHDVLDQIAAMTGIKHSYFYGGQR